MDAPIRFPCSACQRTIKAPGGMAGKALACPACGARVRVPAAAADDDDTFGVQPEKEKKPGPPAAATKGLPKRNTRIPPSGLVLPDEDEPEPRRVGKVGFFESMRRWVAGGADLHSAARNGDLEAVKSLLADGADVDEADRSGRTALHFAVEGGYQTIAKILVKRGADVNARGHDAQPTPLHVASRNDRRALAVFLLTQGAELDARDIRKTEGTPLQVAVSCGHTELARLLVEWGAKLDARGSFELPVKVISLFPAPPQSHECSDWSILHSLAWTGDAELIEVLLRHGANPNSRARMRDARARDVLRLYPMDVAAIKLTVHDGDKGNEAALIKLAEFGGNFAWSSDDVKGVGRALLANDWAHSRLLKDVRHKPILFAAACPSCGNMFPVRSKHTAGKRVACWKCGAELLAEPTPNVSPF